MKPHMLNEAARELSRRADRNLQHADELLRAPICEMDKVEMLARLTAMEHSIKQIRGLLGEV